MLPLTRQDTRPSIHSYWSDSNPGLQGPTINLHAVAKPLMRRMYHRQAMAFITKHRGDPLSKTTLEIYSSYLPWNYVSWPTKAAIMSELSNKAISEVDARAVVDSSVFYHLVSMLGSPDSKVRYSSCMLLGNLASYESTAPVILDGLKPCKQLISLLRDEYPIVIFWATHALCQISQWLDGAQAIVEAEVLGCVLVLLESADTQVRRWTCKMVGNLARYEFTARAILELKLCERMVSLLDEKNPGVIDSVTYALSQIVLWPDGIQAIGEAKVLDHVLVLLESPNPDVCKRTCNLVGRLAGHTSTALEILKLAPYERLVSVLCEEDSRAIEAAAYALSRIAQWPDGAQAMLEAQALNHISRLLELSHTQIRRWTCNLVGNLASHASTGPAILALKPCELLVPLLSDKDTGIIESATYALSRIAEWLKGAEALLDAKAPNHIPALLESSDTRVRKWTCKIVGNLAGHATIAPKILELKLCEGLVSLSSGDDLGAIESTTYALSRIAQWPEGSQAIVDAKGLDCTLVLLESPDMRVRRWICKMVGNLARHEFAVPAIIELRLCERMVSVLGEKNSGVIDSVTYAFSQIVVWSDGAEAIMDAKVLHHVSALLESPNPDVQKWTCRLVGGLASHKSTAPAILESNPCERLATLLHGGDPGLRKWAAYALSQFVRCSSRTHATFNPKVLYHLLRLLEALSLYVWKWTWYLVETPAGLESTAPPILAQRPCEHLVALLRDEDPSAIRKAMYTLSQIPQCLYGPQAFVDAKALDHILTLLESSTLDIREWACKLGQTRVDRIKTLATSVVETAS
ncbi:hypothetical protein MVEN_01009600 [Mycena venus]|uniref:ARM repeat-containing protein n=1 Tax=Mycena venus TaxID=2733690 RepID=A0A8H6YDJ4_9AGAR|nr:hypothetical protein MVEN_01009600 [Mycena venus]